MAEVVNSNIQKTKIQIEEDNKFIQNTIKILDDIERGDFSKRISFDTNNPILHQLRTVLNQMVTNLESNINHVLEILNEYANYNYLNSINDTNLKAHFKKLANRVNLLKEAITNMLYENMNNGIKLKSDSDILTQSVDDLQKSAQYQIQAIKETMQVVNEISSNIKIASEKTQTAFVRSSKKTKLEVKFVSNRIQELNQVLDNTQENNLTNQKKIAAVKKASKKVKQYKKELEQVKQELPKQEQAAVEPVIDQAMQEVQKTSDHALKIVAAINESQENENSPELSSEEIIAKIESDLEKLEAELGFKAVVKARKYFDNKDYVLALEELTNLEKDVKNIDKELKESRDQDAAE